MTTTLPITVGCRVRFSYRGRVFEGVVDFVSSTGHMAIIHDDEGNSIGGFPVDSMVVIKGAS
jgi:hypothetical protein